MSLKEPLIKTKKEKKGKKAFLSDEEDLVTDIVAMNKKNAKKNKAANLAKQETKSDPTEIVYKDDKDGPSSKKKSKAKKSSEKKSATKK